MNVNCFYSLLFCSFFLSLIKYDYLQPHNTQASHHLIFDDANYSPNGQMKIGQIPPCYSMSHSPEHGGTPLTDVVALVNDLPEIGNALKDGITFIGQTLVRKPFEAVCNFFSSIFSKKKKHHEPPPPALTPTPTPIIITKPQEIPTIVKPVSEPEPQKSHEAPTCTPTPKKDLELETYYAQRAQALIETLEHPESSWKLHDYNRQPLPKSSDIPEEYRHLLHNVFTPYPINPFDQQLDKELLKIIDNTSKVNKQHSNNIYMQMHASLIYHFAALAKRQENSYIASELLDCCYHLNKAYEGINHGFVESSRVFISGMTVTATNCLIVRKTEISTKQWEALFGDKNQLEILYETYLEPLHNAATSLYRALKLALKNPSAAVKEAELYLASHIALCKEDPEKAVAFIIETLLPFAEQKIQKLKDIKPLLDAIEMQQRIAAFFAHKKIDKLVKASMNSIEVIINKALELLQKNNTLGEDINLL